MTTPPITATPYLVARGAAAALDFYRVAFDAVERYRLVDRTGRVGHAEFTIGGALLMIADEYPEYDVVAPERPGSGGIGTHLQVSNVDAFVARAAAAGATIVRPPTNEFYGDRSAKLADPFGHVWHVATTIEAVSPEEMQRRFDALYG